MKPPGQRPPQPSPARPFGVGWLLSFLALSLGGTVLWAGIGAGALALLRREVPGAARWVLLAGLVAVFVFLPALFARAVGFRSFRAFQGLALGTALVLAIGAGVLRREALLETSRGGLAALLQTFGGEQHPEALPTPSGPPIPAPAAPLPAPRPAPAGPTVEPASETVAAAFAGDDLSQWTERDALRTWLGAQAYAAEQVGKRVPHAADAVTRDSARKLAEDWLQLTQYGVGMWTAISLGQADDPTEREALVARMRRLAEALPGLEAREAMRQVEALNLEVTRHYAHLARADQRYSEDAVRKQVERDADTAECTPKGEVLHCFLEGESYGLQLEREDGVWRVNAKLEPPPSRTLPSPFEPHRQPSAEECAAMETEGACLRTALAELQACVDAPAEGKGRWLARELGLDHALCTFPHGETVEFRGDGRQKLRSRLDVTFRRGADVCGTLQVFSIQPRPPPGHQSRGALLLSETTITTRSGTVRLRDPGRVGQVGQDGVCLAGCLQTLTCPDGKTWERPRGCVDQWRTLGAFGWGPSFNLSTFDATAPFVRCSTPNVLSSVGPPTPVDMHDDPRPPLPAP